MENKSNDTKYNDYIPDNSLDNTQKIISDLKTRLQKEKKELNSMEFEELSNTEVELYNKFRQNIIDYINTNNLIFNRGLIKIQHQLFGNKIFWQNKGYIVFINGNITSNSDLRYTRFIKCFEKNLTKSLSVYRVKINIDNIRIMLN
jgi:hypothetical protein